MFWNLASLKFFFFRSITDTGVKMDAEEETAILSAKVSVPSIVLRGTCVSERLCECVCEFVDERFKGLLV